jgi:hypothetical protein
MGDDDNCRRSRIATSLAAAGIRAFKRRGREHLCLTPCWLDLDVPGWTWTRGMTMVDTKKSAFVVWAVGWAIVRVRVPDGQQNVCHLDKKSSEYGNPDMVCLSAVQRLVMV